MKIIAIAAAALPLALAGCGESTTSQQDAASAPANAAAATYSGTGQVTALAPDLVTISHGPIEEIGWPAMTMGFRPTSPDMVRGIQVGDRVIFAFRETGSSHELTSLAKAP